MLKNKVIFRYITGTLLILVLLMGAFQYQANSEVEPIKQVEGKIKEISEAEKAVLQDLFTLSQQIDETGKKQAEISDQLQKLKTDMETLSVRIEKNRKSYDQQREVLKKILVNYQKRGPASYLETFLSAGDLTTFLKSLNILKDMSKNTQELLDSIQNTKVQLEQEKEQLAVKEALVIKTQEELQKAMADMLALKEKQEAILVSLAEQREVFEDELKYIETMWNENKALFANIIEYFNTIISRGNLPADKLILKLEFPGIRATLTEEVLNEVLGSHPDLPAMVFHFHPDRIDVEVPEKQLSLKCHFVIENRSSVTFIIDEGSFYGMPLTQSSIAELLENGTLKLDFKELLGVVTVDSAQTFDGYMDVVLVPLLGN